MLRGAPGSSSNEACAFEGENHLVDGRRSDAEVSAGCRLRPAAADGRAYRRR